MPADLTSNPYGFGAVTYGLECPEHPEAVRTDLTQAHATNAVAKHNRDYHPSDSQRHEVNVTAAAKAAYDLLDADAWVTPAQIVQYGAVRAAAIEFLEGLTGLEGLAAIEQAAEWAYAEPAITAHVAPF